MSPSSSSHFELMHWDAPDAPTAEQLVRLLKREGYTPGEEKLAHGKTNEMHYSHGMVYVLVHGALYIGFPGYGSVDLNPGDILEIKPAVTHDITVTSHDGATLLKAARN